MDNNNDQTAPLVTPGSETSAPETPETPAPVADTPAISVPDPTPPAMPEPSTPMPSTPVEPQPMSSDPGPDMPKAAGPSSGMGMAKKVLMIILVLLIPAGAYGGYAYANSKADTAETKLNTQIGTLTAAEHDMPAGLTKASDCVPNMGFHYLTKTSDSRYGPFLLVNKENKVIGVEYMASEDMFTKIPATDPPVELVTKDSPMYGWKFDHFEISHLPKGHEGLPTDHIDVHLYTVTPAVEKNACV